MKFIPAALILVALATNAVAQTTAPNSTSGTTSMAPAGLAMAPTDNGQAAAAGNDNQAVATTTANATQPAHGANSFSKREARRRIARHGFQQVAGLSKDKNGVWRGTATQGGNQVNVWLDFKGNVGQQ